MELKLREIVTGKDGNDTEVKLAVVRPNQKLLKDAQVVYNMEVARLLRQAAAGGDRLFLRSELEDHLERIGIWTADDRARFVAIQLELRDMEMALRTGGIKVSEGRDLAIEMDAKRKELMAHYSKRAQFDGTTIESHAENHRFEFLSSRSIVKADTGEPCFSGVDDYVNKSTEPVVVMASAKLAQMMFGLDTDALKNTPEQKWLRDYKFIDGEGRFVNKEAQLTDRSGRLIDKEGRLIDDQGRLVDWKGNLVDDEGNLLVPDPKPFIDDETGKPVTPGAEALAPSPSSTDPPKKPKPSRGSETQ